MTEKYKIMLSALATGRMVRVAFTPDSQGVVVPADFRSQLGMMLDFGYNAPQAIDDLVCNDVAISGTLHFGGVGGGYFWCSVPWGAVVSIEAIGPTPAQRAWTPMVLDGGKN